MYGRKINDDCKDDVMIKVHSVTCMTILNNVLMIVQGTKQKDGD